MKKIEIEVSGSAFAVLNEMARRGQTSPASIGRVALENSLAQSIDRRVARDGDSWLLNSARNATRACRRWWKEVELPGNYAAALGRKEAAPPKINPNLFRVEQANGYAVWNLNAEFRKILKPIADEFGVSIEEFLRLYSRGELPNQPENEPHLEHVPIPAGFAFEPGDDSDITARILRAAEFSGRTVAELVWDAVSGFVACCEDDMIFSPKTWRKPVGDEVNFGKFLIESHRWPVVAKAAA